MRPRVGSLPHHSKQSKTDGTTPSAPQQVKPSNHYQGNPGNILPNSAQFQSQIGANNPQIGIPFNNSNTHLGNGNKSIPNRPVSTPSTCFMNPTNHFLPLQNVVMPNPGGQFHGGFGQNLNPFAAVFQNLSSVQNTNGMNPSQPPGQFFAPNPTQFMNLPNGQFCLRNPFVQMQQPNYPQPQVLLPFNLQMFPNQGTQPMGPQNSTFISNQQFGMANSIGAAQPSNQNDQKFIPPTADANSLKQTPNAQQTQKNFRPPFFPKSQGTPGQNSGRNNLNNNWKNSRNRKFTRNPRADASSTGSLNSQLHHANSAKEKFGFHNAHGPKGYSNNGGRKSDNANCSNQNGVEKKRSLCLNYTDEEIKRWREERKNNYPSRVNIDKKQTEKLTEPEVSDRDAKIRRQQLKEILAKQAELGIEIAEIPSSYLSDSEKPLNGREDGRVMTKNERFQNKFNKRGRSRKNDRSAKKQRFADDDSCNVHDRKSQFPERRGLPETGSSNKREPTLLEKLLSTDIRREKSHLLQVFRFMVMNSFFKDWPDKPLRFPSVVVKEDGCEVEVVDEKSAVLASRDVIKDSEDVERDGNDVHYVRVKGGNFDGLKGTIARETIVEEAEEEGEILD